MKEKIAIIGGNGFIGKNFTNYFANSNYEVLVIDNNLKNLIQDFHNVTSSSVDIHHTKGLIKELKNTDYVIWLVHASIPSTQDESLVDDFMLNISPIIKFLEKSKKLLDLKKFIYFSSGGTIYGDKSEQTPIVESDFKKPISNYGLSKLIAEKYIEKITQGKHFNSIILRPSNVYGPYQNLVKPQGIIGYAFNSIKNNSKLTLYDQGRVIRDFIFVKDAAKAIEKIIKNDKDIQKGETSFFNLGSGKGYSIKQVLEKIEKITNQKINFEHKSSRNFDCNFNVLNPEKLNRTYDWECDTQLDDGLQEVWNWVKNTET